jgi:Fe-S cluster biogenesis protein NfuA
MKIPIDIYSEMTPNPLALKFVANVNFIDNGNVVEFKNKSETKGFSPLAEELFLFPFVDGVLIAANFITILKTDNVPWDFITSELRQFIKSWLENGKTVLNKDVSLDNFENIKNDKNNLQVLKFEPSYLDSQIVSLLDQYVRPAVEHDGGAINFSGYKDGKVFVVLKGSCSGCPSSVNTLKFGIENLLKKYIPEINEVISVN